MAQIDDLQAAVDALKVQVASIVNQQRFPIGTVLSYAGTDVPPGFLLADGKTIDPTQAQYAALAALIGTSFVLPGDPVGTCRLPNLVGRVVRGATAAADFGQLSGSDNQMLTLNNLPQHRHGVVGCVHPDGADQGRMIAANDTPGGSIAGAPNAYGFWWDYHGTYTTTEPAATTQFSVVQASCNLSYIVKY